MQGAIDPISGLTPEEIWARDYAPFIPIQLESEAPATFDYNREMACDVLIIGAGPAGIAAADLAARSGALTVLLEKDDDFGGATPNSDVRNIWLAETLDRLSRTQNAILMRGTNVSGLQNPNCYSANCPISDEAIAICPKTTVLATGASPRISNTPAGDHGWNPNLHLACHLGAKPSWNATINAFVPVPNMVTGMYIAGAAAGVFTTTGAQKSGAYRCRLALQAIGLEPATNNLPPLPDAD